MDFLKKLSTEKVTDIIADKYEHINKNTKLAAAVTFFVTVIANMYVFTNRWINHDDLLGDFKTGTISTYLGGGKWMQYYFKMIGTEFGAPVIHGILSAVILAFTAACLMSIFQIEDKILVVLLGALLGTFPLNACYFGYMSSADIYYFALITAVFSVWLVEKNTITGFILGSISLMISLATYQSYLSVAVGLIVIIYYVKLMQEETDLKVWFLKGLRDTGMVFAAFFLYQIATKILLRVNHVSLQAYANEDQLFVFTPSAVLDSVVTGYRNFGSWMYTTNKVSYQGWAYANIIITLVIAIVAVYRFFNYIRKKKIVQALLLALLSLALPILLNNIYLIMNGRGWIHALTHYCLILIYILVTVVIQYLPDICRKVNKPVVNILQTMGIFGMAVIIYFGFIISNQLYTRMNSNMNAINAELTTMMARVSSVEGYTADTPVYFANCNDLLGENYHKLDIYSEKIDSGVWTGTDVYPWCNAGHISTFLEEYMYIQIPGTPVEKAKVIDESEELANMGVYPAEDSIQMIDGVVVVKMRENENNTAEDNIMSETLVE